MADDPLADVPAPVGVPVPTRLPESLALPASSAQVAQFVALRAAACVGADYANLALLDDAGTSLRLFHHTSLHPDIADRYTDVAIDAGYPIAAAVREGRVVLLTDIEAYRAQFPDIVEDTIAAGIHASASLPLHRSDGSTLGGLGFGWTDVTTFHPKLEAALRAVAVLCVETVERAERYDTDHELVVTMQRRLLGELPSLSGVETSARYLPATTNLAVGGDWYEGLLLGANRMALVVGDVTGHGIAAAADMALIRGMVSALLHSGVAISDVFFELGAVLSQRTGLLLATAALVVADVEHETVTFSTAGHPPPLLRLPDGEIRRLDSAHSPIIGISDRRRVADTAPFPKGSTLVMYTDGLVERRDRPVTDGIDLATAQLQGLAGDMTGDALVEALIGELVGDVAADDIALLVVRHTGDPAGGART
jgi:Stage II sporulation protein E (SpoIIE)/GAF domain